MTPTIIQSHTPDPPVVRQADMLAVKGFAVTRGWGYEREEIAFGTTDTIENVMRLMVAADEHHFRRLAAEPGLVHVCWDCLLTEEFQYLDDGRPHLGFYPQIPRPDYTRHPDVFLMYGPCEWFAARLQDMETRYPSRPFPWQKKVLRDRTDIVEIPTAWYSHAHNSAKWFMPQSTEGGTTCSRSPRPRGYGLQSSTQTALASATN